MRTRTDRFAALLFPALIFLGLPGHASAQGTALSQSQSPFQLTTASVAPVKVSGVSDADALVVIYRQSDDAAAASGTAGDVSLSFYNAAGSFIKTVATNLTKPEVDLANTGGNFLVSKVFNTTGSGVILAQSTGGDARVGMSVLQVDNTLPAITERQSLPAIVRESLAASAAVPGTDSVWGGFSSATFEEYFLAGSGFKTNLQFVCPASGTALATAMTGFASLGTLSANPLFTLIRVYDHAGTLLGTLSNVSCAAFTENPGTVQSLMAGVPAIMGFLNMSVNSAAAGWRTVVLTASGSSVWFDGWMRRAAGETTSSSGH